MAVKLRKPIEIPEDGAFPDAPRPIPLKPLAVSGVVITKAALIEALRVYVPNLADFEVVEDADRFVLSLTPSTNPIERQELTVRGGSVRE